jgi:hypothetical protein
MVTMTSARGLQHGDRRLPGFGGMHADDGADGRDHRGDEVEDDRAAIETAVPGRQPVEEHVLRVERTGRRGS